MTVIAPFINKTKPFAKGMNPLGMQNYVESAYSKLLVGLTNSTNRVRYYSMYCWLLYEYRLQHADSTEYEQQTYIRKAEYLLALINAYGAEEYRGEVPGILYANKLIAAMALTTDSVINLRDGVYNEENKTTGTYLKNTGGAFRQYYFASMHDLGLVYDCMDETNKHLTLTVVTDEEKVISGQQLALCVRDSIHEKLRKKFLDCINKELVTLDELSEFETAFSLRTIIKKKERNHLIKLFLQKDFPLSLDNDSCLRNESFVYVLSYVHQLEEGQKYTEEGFIEHIYKLFIKDSEHQYETFSFMKAGWFYYRIHELWQYYSVELFNNLLGYLKVKYGGRWAGIDTLVHEYASEICDELHNLYNVDSSTPLNLLWSSINHPIEWQRLDKSLAIIQIICNYKVNFEYIIRGMDFCTHHGVERSDDFIYCMRKLQSMEDKPFLDVLIKYLKSSIVYRHYLVGMRRYQQTGNLTLKFMIENNMVRYISCHSPSWSRPRLKNTYIFLCDLGLIENDRLTEKGAKILTKHGQRYGL